MKLRSICKTLTCDGQFKLCYRLNNDSTTWFMNKEKRLVSALDANDLEPRGIKSCRVIFRYYKFPVAYAIYALLSLCLLFMLFHPSLICCQGKERDSRPLPQSTDHWLTLDHMGLSLTHIWSLWEGEAAKGAGWGGGGISRADWATEGSLCGRLWRRVTATVVILMGVLGPEVHRLVLLQSAAYWHHMRPHCKRYSSL